MLTIERAKMLRGEITVPGDKSVSHRGLILGSMAHGSTVLKNFPFSLDCLSTAECLRSLGVRISLRHGRAVKISGKAEKGFSRPKDVLFAGNSATTVRLLAGALSGESFESIIDGDPSLRKRPMRRIVGPLTTMGANIQAREGEFAPLRIRGGSLRGITYELPVASAQVKTAILLAGLRATGRTTVREGTQSRDHTERMLRAMGAMVHEKEGRVTVEGGSRLEGIEIDVPGDFSSAAFFIVAALTVPDSELLLKNVGLNPGRTGLLSALQKMGADIRVEQDGEHSSEPVGSVCVRTSMLTGTVVEAGLIPSLVDEIPILALAATQARGETVIRNAGELRKKETDRIRATVNVLRALGAQAEEMEDGLAIMGPSALSGATIASEGDHRIAMMGATAALIARGKTCIVDSGCIDVSFPGFTGVLNAVVRWEDGSESGRGGRGA
jgi:3-phosphoshikimate 1-carboxyvinyltransferase